MHFSFVARPKGKDHLEEQRVDGLKVILQKQDVKMQSGFKRRGISAMVSCSEHGDPLGSVKGGKCHQLGVFQILKHDSAP
jgi:hypothetical protein